MERITRFRAMLFLVLFLGIIGLFCFNLYDQQIIQTGGGTTKNEATFITQTRVKAARGEILDRNGNVLVSNRASYDMVLNHYVLLSAKGTNNHIFNLVTTCRDLNIEYNDSFPITKQRPFTYILDQQNGTQQGYFQSYLTYMGDIDSDITAPVLVQKLRELYNIPAAWSDDDARLVIGIRYEMALRNCIETMSTYVFLTDASDEALSAIVELNVPGLAPEATTVREIHTKYASHILGYVGPMTEAQWEQYKDVEGYAMDTEIGQDGFEAEFEQWLHGVDGLREDTVTADGTLVKQRWLVEPKAGTNVEVSIDIDLQRVAEDALGDMIVKLQNQPPDENGEPEDGTDAIGGAVVCMDMQGRVLVCGSYPSYDLNTFFEDYDAIMKQDGDPLYNRPLLAAYPPGSTYKMSMVVTAIENGVIDADTVIRDQGKFTKEEYGDFYVTCLAYSAYGYVHGNLTAKDALMVSCNYFFYVLGDTCGIKQIDATAKALGLGEPTGVELYEEVGHRSNTDTKKKLHPESPYFNPGDQLTTAIGQSDNKFTPIQLCVYTMTLANQGVRYKASFLNRVVSADYRTLTYSRTPTVLSELKISDEAYNAYVEGMYLVCHGNDGVFVGTAYDTFKYYPINVCGKTGTADTEISYAGLGSANGAFICFAPMEDPQIAICVYGERVGHGNTLAAVAKTILDAYFEIGEATDVETYENQIS